MRRTIASIIIVFALAMAGCATTSTTTQTMTVLTTLATDAAYVGYRVSPEIRTTLDAVCLLSSLDDQAKLAVQLKELLGKVWVDANKLSDNDAVYVLLAINNLVGLAGLNTETVTTNLAGLKQIVAGICSGVSLAQKSGTGVA